MSKYKKPKVGFLDHVAGKQDNSNPIDDVLKEAAESAPVSQPEPKKTKPQTKKPVIREEVRPPAPGMESYVKATQVDPASAKGSFDEKAVEGYTTPIAEEKKLKTDPNKMSAYQKAIQESKKNKKDSVQHLGEAADLLGGETEKPVTQADLRALKVSMASLGGGGLGERDVIDLISRYGADSVADLLDSDQIQQILDAVTPIGSTDSVPEGSTNLYYTDARVDSNFALKTTDDLTEGSSNLYYTDTRSRSAIQSIDSALQYDKVTGNLALNTDFISTYNSNDFDSDLASNTTDDLTEGSANLYHTDARARSAIQSIDSSLIYDSTTGNLSLAIDPDEFYTSADFDSDFSLKSTDSLSEGSENLYYTDSRARAAISSGDSYIVYDSLSGEISLSGELTGDFVEKTGDSMTGDLRMRSGSGILVDSGNVRAQHGYVQTNTLKSVGNSNIVVQRNNERRMLWGTHNITADKKIKYNSGYNRDSYTSDLNGTDSYTLMPKWYVDDEIDNSLLATTDSLSEGTANLYYTTTRFDSDFESTNIRSDHDSLASRVDSDDIEIANLKNKVDALDLNSAIALDYDKILSFDSTTDSVPRGEYGIHFSGGTSYADVDKFYFNNFDRNDVFVPYEETDSNDVIVITDSDGGLARYEVQGTTDFGNHFRIDVTPVLAKGAPSDLISMKLFPAVDNLDLAPYAYVDAKDAILQQQINSLDSAIDSEHAWNVAEHSALQSNLNSDIDSEHAWNVSEHKTLQDNIGAEVTARTNADSDLNARVDTEVSDRTGADTALQSNLDSDIDSEHAWNVAEHEKEITARQNADSDLDSDISTKVSKSGDTMTGDLTLTNPSRLSANTIGGVGNSNLNIKRWNDTKIQITSTANKNFQKITFNSNYGVTDDLDVPHKMYVDAAIDSAVANASFVFDSSQFVDVTGDSMSGELAIRRTAEHNVGLRIKKDTQSRFTIRADGKLNWTADATNAVLNKNGGDFSISIDDVNFMKFDQSQGDIEVAKTLTLTGTEKVINLPNNSDTGQLQSNGNRRLFWDQNNVGIDVVLKMSAQLDMNGDGSGKNKIINLANPTDDYHAATKKYVDTRIIDPNGFIKNGGTTTLTGITHILAGSSGKWMNIQAATNSGTGFFVMRNYEGDTNLFQVNGDGTVLLSRGRMATDLDEVTTKRYVDAKVDGGSGVLAPGRRFKFERYDQGSTVPEGCFSPYRSDTGPENIFINRTDLDGMRLAEGAPDYTPGISMPVTIYKYESSTWKSCGFGTWGLTRTNYHTSYFTVKTTWVAKPALIAGQTYALVIGGKW